MAFLKIDKIKRTVRGNIQITGSKSESNRLLVLQQFYKNLKIENISNSDDSRIMQQALASRSKEINIGHAGTAMRFLTAYFSVMQHADIILTGSHRMQNRPIKILVSALRKLGAEIHYLEKEGYPPLKIKGAKLNGDFVEIEGNVSSQYISALLLIAPFLENGLKLKFIGEITSVPYIKMTLTVLAELGVELSWDDDSILIQPKPTISTKTMVVESDWSSASYYFSLVALSPNAEVTLSSYKQNSIQGDSVLVEIYKKLGVKTAFKENAIILSNESKALDFKRLTLDLINAPDIAQTIAVTCFGLGIECFLTGLHTLKIKETDRLVALKNEIEKFGGEVHITDEALHLKAATTINENVMVATYDDHRMAMAFAPLASKVSLGIENPAVVAKSYPSFWEDFEKIIR